MPSHPASFAAFATYHAVVAPVLGTDPAAVDAGLVEAALDAVLAKRPSLTSSEERKAAYHHLRKFGLNLSAFKLHYEIYLKNQCNDRLIPNHHNVLAQALSAHLSQLSSPLVMRFQLLFHLAHYHLLAKTLLLAFSVFQLE